MEIALTALAAAVLGALGPAVIGRLREPLPPEDPADADPPKELYADLARARHLGVWLVATSGLAAALVAWRIDLPELLPVWAVLCGTGSWLSYIDWRTRLLPYDIVAPVYGLAWLGVGGAALATGDADVALRALVANVAVFGFLWLLHAIGGLGYGDVRLGAVIAVALGPLGAGAVVLGLWTAFLSGGIGGLVLARLGIVERSSFALGPYLVAGAVVGAVWGPRVYG